MKQFLDRLMNQGCRNFPCIWKSGKDITSIGHGNDIFIRFNGIGKLHLYLFRRSASNNQIIFLSYNSANCFVEFRTAGFD